MTSWRFIVFTPSDLSVFFFRTVCPLAAEARSKEHQWPYTSAGKAPLGVVAIGTSTELLSLVTIAWFGDVDPDVK
ncbi:hypothetical protein HID58_031461 [Brassica napus]|uniref:Uncharacterized protein n=1 Tax=Brassica napus TaxID=3708 RepID=A0ABQ8BV76_BRANA|nr:hypothetical protein HID58_031461 [Brassica napus]